MSYKADGICWAAAEDFVARSRSACAAQTPSFATITSASENKWIIEKLLTPGAEPCNPGTQLGKSQVWVGGVQDEKS